MRTLARTRDTSQDAEIQHGTRVLVSRILGGLAGGMSNDEVLREYEISEADLRAAPDDAARLRDEEQFHPLPVSSA